jgi:hypothetical protein
VVLRVLDGIPQGLRGDHVELHLHAATPGRSWRTSSRARRSPRRLAGAGVS